jgi:RNA polymerase sigma-70 factor, ECF subfamily
MRKMTNLELQLIESVKQGDIKSFELLFKSYYSRLCRYAHHYVRDKVVVEDLVKDALLKIWENRNKINISTSLAGYLYRSVHNSCVNHATRNHKNANILYESELQDLPVELMHPLSNDYPVANLIAQELEEKLSQSIQSLPEQCREIFILSRMDDLSHEEIAKKKNISTNTVKVQIYRALIKLRIDLKEYLPAFIAIFLPFFNFL